ncbi:MAG: phosphate ABC transporter ATP-binding protein [SAR202 cluster bacterium]|nr:phosphate ABC transporter ATP-binding protein [SAR202 cluster bacterium]
MIDVVPDEEARLIVRNVHAYYGEAHAVKDITFAMRSRKVTAIIGPSGCGKSTLLRCMNRMHEEQRAARVEGQIILDGENIYDRSVDPVLVRRRIGMVFQKPNPFPTMSIADNVLAGYKLNRVRAGKGDLAERCEVALRRAALWDEVKDQLNRPGTDLSGGQQQRLCIARSLAVDPEILLMDEPCSALDPLATARIEDLVKELSQEITVVIVTHNMQQAARVSDMTAFMLLGRMIEYGPTTDMFTTPRDERTEAYITGRFG